MRRLVAVIIFTGILFTSQSINAQVNVPVSDTNLVDKIYAGMLASINFTDTQLSTENWSNLRVGGFANWQIAP